MADFKTALLKLLGNEGTYANNANDHGKETYCGISRHYFPNWEGWKIIDSVKLEPGFPKTLNNVPNLKGLVENFYRVEFWNKIDGDKLNKQSIANELFDTSVIMSVMEAVKMLQQSLNLLNRNGKNYPDIFMDGKMGPTTLNTVNNFDEEAVLLRSLNTLQGSHFIASCLKDPSQEEFYRGWLKRAS